MKQLLVIVVASLGAAHFADASCNHYYEGEINETAWDFVELPATQQEKATCAGNAAADCDGDLADTLFSRDFECYEFCTAFKDENGNTCPWLVTTDAACTPRTEVRNGNQYCHSEAIGKYGCYCFD